MVPARGMGTHAYLKGIFVPEEESGYSVLGAEEEDFAEEEETTADPTPTTIVVWGPEHDTAPPIQVKHEWQIDDESFALEILDRRTVLPLLSSSRIQKITEGHGSVALAFRPGKGAGSKIPPGTRAPGRRPGVVVSVLSHFGKQGSAADEHSIQNLLLNVLLDAYASPVGPHPNKKP